MEQVRVVFAEDGDLLRAGLLALLERDPTVEVVGVATTLPEALALVDEQRPDVVLTDVRMPPSLTDEGIRASIHWREQYPQMGVVVLTQYADVEYALDVIRHGSDYRAFLLKERVGAVGELVYALHTVASGGSVIDRTMVESLMETGTQQRDSVLDRLTNREREVLTLVAEGLTNQGIADRLVVSHKAVEKHINAIFAKLDLPADAPLHRRVAATLLFLSEVGVGGSTTGELP